MHKSMSLKYEPSTEPLHMSENKLFLMGVDRAADFLGVLKRLHAPPRFPINYLLAALPPGPANTVQGVEFRTLNPCKP